MPPLAVVVDIGFRFLLRQMVEPFAFPVQKMTVTAYVDTLILYTQWITLTLMAYRPLPAEW